MRPIIVAELSANHLGGIERALQLIDAAKEAGADCVKFQTYRAAEMVGPHGYVIPDGPWAGRDLLSLYKEAETPRAWHRSLFDYARSIGIEPFSTPFSKDDVDFLEQFDCPRYKIASFELVDLRLIEHAAKTGKPLIMSTGMATREEIEDAVLTARDAGCEDITLLKCTSAYPAPASSLNLKAGKALTSMGVEWGLSDHTTGIAAPVAATVMGAAMIEKHFTLNRADGGPDAKFSLQPDEFALMVEACRDAAAAIGQVQYGPTESEIPQLALRRSLYFVNDLDAGRMVTAHLVHPRRPALGLHPKFHDVVVGSVLAKPVKAGDPVTWDVLKTVQHHAA